MPIIQLMDPYMPIILPLLLQLSAPVAVTKLEDTVTLQTGACKCLLVFVIRTSLTDKKILQVQLWMDGNTL